MSAAASAPSGDVITLTSLDISPSGPVAIDAGLTLTFAFDSTIEMAEAHWEFKYVVDSASKRHVIELGATPKTKYVKGKNTFEFSAPKIDITGVKPSVLLNVGLLTCTLFNGSTQIVEVKIMTQVTKKKDGSLARVMFDPLA